ncbi:MAG: hypothetical protein V3U85_00240 [Hyphomicrobium sp.]
MAKTPRNKISKYADDTVGASSSSNTPLGANPLPAERIIRLTCFGASLPGKGRVELQLRTAVGPPVWTVIRCVAGPDTMHFENIPVFVGDGTIATLRIRRINDETTDQEIRAWAEGFRRKG